MGVNEVRPRGLLTFPRGRLVKRINTNHKEHDVASYLELHDTQSNNELNRRVQAACAIAAETIRGEDVGTTNHANRLTWAAGVFVDPGGESRRMLWAVLAANKDSTVAQITGATDAQIQTAVDTAVDLFATG